MAERRMFAKTIIDSDAFLDMPPTSQLLYFHLAMRADDEGFINKPKTILRTVRCNEDDMKILIAKKFVIPFESGIVVIKHWKIHNYIQKDRFNATKCTEEKAMLGEEENKTYKLLEGGCIQNVSKMDTECIQDVSKMDTQVRLDKSKDSIDKVIVSQDKVSQGKDSQGEDTLLDIITDRYLESLRNQ